MVEIGGPNIFSLFWCLVRFGLAKNSLVVWLPSSYLYLYIFLALTSKKSKIWNKKPIKNICRISCYGNILGILLKSYKLNVVSLLLPKFISWYQSLNNE